MEEIYEEKKEVETEGEKKEREGGREGEKKEREGKRGQRQGYLRRHTPTQPPLPPLPSPFLHL